MPEVEAITDDVLVLAALEMFSGDGDAERNSGDQPVYVTPAGSRLAGVIKSPSNHLVSRKLPSYFETKALRTIDEARKIWGNACRLPQTWTRMSNYVCYVVERYCQRYHPGAQVFVYLCVSGALRGRWCERVGSWFWVSIIYFV